MRRCFFCFVFLTASLGVRGADENTAADEKILQAAGVSPHPDGLLAFFRKRCITDRDRELLEARIRQLGDRQFKLRQEASRVLIDQGPGAVPLLRQALHDPDLEISRRAQTCLDQIQRGKAADPALCQAAVRLLADRQPMAALEVLIDFVGFNEDEMVEDEVFAALRRLQSPLPAGFETKLHDPHSARRAAAGYLLCRRGSEAQRALARPLLQDPESRVRLRTAEGLLAGQDKGAVPTAIALLEDNTANVRWKAEELLYRLAAGQPPAGSAGDSVSARQKYRLAWEQWWQANQDRVDLTALRDEPISLGLVLAVEMDSNLVWEFGPDGKMRWKIERLQGPMDAQLLPGNRVLVAEYQGRRVTERDWMGNIHWTYAVGGNPITCQRLPNGNTFIATHTHAMEISRDGREVYQRRFPPGLFVFGARKLPGGNILYIANPGVIEEMDPQTGKVQKSIGSVRDFGGWCGIEPLPGGRYLVALSTNGKVLELDASGQPVWEASVPSAAHAVRLPNGNTVVAAMMNHRIVELNREGKQVKDLSTEGRPWRVHYR